MRGGRVKSAFWGISEGRLRFGWRLLAFLVIGALSVAPLAVVADRMVPPFLESFANAALGAVGMSVAVWLTARFVDRYPVAHFGLAGWSRWPTECIVGAVISMLAMVAAVLPMWWFGALELRGHLTVRYAEVGFLSAMTLQVLRYLTGILAEEIFSRGYLLANLADVLSSGRARLVADRLACVLTAVVFALLHLVSGSTGPLSLINIFFLALLFGWGRIVTGRLALPIGLHFGWNLAQNNIFGLANGGKASEAAFAHLAPVSHSSTWLTGGAGGPEAGVMGSAAIAIGGCLLWMARSRSTLLSASRAQIDPAYSTIA